MRNSGIKWKWSYFALKHMQMLSQFEVLELRYWPTNCAFIASEFKMCSLKGKNGSCIPCFKWLHSWWVLNQAVREAVDIVVQLHKEQEHFCSTRCEPEFLGSHLHNILQWKWAGRIWGKVAKTHQEVRPSVFCCKSLQYCWVLWDAHTTRNKSGSDFPQKH